MTGTGSAGQWLGTASNDWFTASNWCGGVPTATTDVVISSGTPFQPVINAGGAVCRNITLNSGASLDIVGTNGLFVAGNWTDNGASFIRENSTVTFNGAGAQTINGTSASETFIILSSIKQQANY